MEVNGDYRPATVTQPAANADAPTREPVSAKIPEGTVIQGEIVDLQRGQVTLRTADGQLVTGRSDKALEALIGLKQSFAVRYDEKGALLLESGAAPDDARNAMLVDLLRSYGLKTGSENIDMLTYLLQNNLPLDPKTVTQFNQAWRLMDADPAKALFFLQNEIRVNSKNAELLNGFTDGTAKLNAQLKSLLDSLSNITDPAVRERLAEILLRGGGAENALETPASAQETTGTAVKPGGADMPQTGRTALDTGVGLASTPAPDEGASTTRSLDDAARPLIGPESFSAAVDELPALMGKIREALASDGLTGERLGEFLRELTGSGAPSSKERIAHLLRSLFETDEPDASVVERLRAALDMPDKKSGLMQRLADRMTFQMEKNSPKDVDRFLNGLREDILAAGEELAKTPAKTADITRMLGELEHVREHIDFAAHVKSNLFVQLPLLVNDRDTHAELYVFKDGKKAGRGASGVSSALIALDTVHLGRFETYIQKTEKEVHLQFRLDSEDTEQLVRQNIPKLKHLLDAYGYRLSGLAYKQVDESFTLLDKEPVMGVDDSLPERKDRVVFDMRT